MRFFVAEVRHKDLVSAVSEQGRIIAEISSASTVIPASEEIVVDILSKKSRFSFFKRAEIFAGALEKNDNYMEVRKPLNLLDMRTMARQLLDYASCINIGEQIAFSINNRLDRSVTISSDYMINICRVICRNAGLPIQKISSSEKLISFLVVKESLWDHDYINIYNGDEFLDEMYKLAFDRVADHDAAVWRARLNSGTSERFIAQRIFSLSERIRIITQNISISESSSSA